MKEKTSKGYTPGEDGTPYQLTDKQDRATGIVPQLLLPIEESEAEPLIADDRWLMQGKFDGRRVLVVKNGQDVIGVNRTGLTIALQIEIASAVRAIGCQLPARRRVDRRPLPRVRPAGTRRHRPAAAALLKAVKAPD